MIDLSNSNLPTIPTRKLLVKSTVNHIMNNHKKKIHKILSKLGMRVTEMVTIEVRIYIESSMINCVINMHPILLRNTSRSENTTFTPRFIR